MTNRMAELTWPEVEARLAAGAVVLIPVGSQEGHSTHLPLSTDTIIVSGACDAIAERIDALIAPPLPFGYKSQVRAGGGHHWPGNIGLDGDLLAALVRRIVKDLVDKGATRIAVINGHFENVWFITEACNLAMEDVGSEVKIMSADWWAMLDGPDFLAVFDPPPGDASYEHAALVETSVVMHLAPETVRTDRVPDHDFLQFPPYDLYPAPDQWITETGALAPTLNADAEKGRRILETAAAKLADAIRIELTEQTEEN